MAPAAMPIAERRLIGVLSIESSRRRRENLRLLERRPQEPLPEVAMLS